MTCGGCATRNPHTARTPQGFGPHLCLCNYCKLSARACNVHHMKRILTAAIIPLVLAGCATGAQSDELDPGLVADAEAGCAEAVGNEYVQEQQPPVLDIRSTVHDGGVVTLSGISRGNTTSPVPYEFTCRHSGGATVLVSMERAEDEEKDEPDVSEKAVQLVDYPNSVQFAQRIELSSSIPLGKRATYASIHECLDLLAGDFKDEIVTVMVDEGVESGPSIIVSGTAQSGSLGATEFVCQDVGDGLFLAYHGPDR